MKKRGPEYTTSNEERARRKETFLRRLGFRGSEAFQADSAAGAALYSQLAENYTNAKREWELRRIEESQRITQRILRVLGSAFGIHTKEEQFLTIEGYIEDNCSRIIQLHDAVTGILPMPSHRRLLRDMDLTKETGRQLLEEMREQLGFSSIDVLAKSASRIRNYTRASGKRK